MYNVSNDYIDRVHALTRTDTIYGTLTFPNGDSVPITESNIGQGSVSISRACVDGDELNFGSAIMAELSISIRSEQNRYNFYGSKISLTYAVKLTKDSWAEVPLGIFTVAEATRVGKLVKLIAYDNLQAFDVPFGDTVVAGSAYSVLSELCDLCGVTLGMDVRDFETIPNGLEVIQIDSSNGCKTLRDAVKIVCQMICGFAVADRDGTIKVRHFGKVPVETLTENDRYSTMVEDFNCSYVAVQVTGLSGTYSARTKEIRDGLTLYLDDAPAWDYGLENVLQNRVDTIMAYIEDLEYTPCEISMPGNPAYDCGDRIVVSVDGELIETIIMEIDWQFRNKMKLTSKGTNLFNLGSSETSNRMLSRESATNKLEFYHYTNPDELSITGKNDGDICNLHIATVSSTSVIFLASIVLDVETTEKNTLNIDTNTALVLEDDSVIDITGTTTTPKECEVKVTYLLNNIDEEYYPTFKLVDGTNTITLVYNIDGLSSQSTYNWVVNLTPLNGIVKIKEWGAKFTLFGQGLVEGSAAWDGRITVEDAFDVVQVLHNIGVVPFNTEAEGGTQVVENQNPTDIFAPVLIRKRVGIVGFDSELVDNLVYKHDTISTKLNVSPEGYNDYYVEDDIKFTQRRVYDFIGEEISVDSGIAFKADLNTTQFLRTDEMEVL